MQSLCDEREQAHHKHKKLLFHEKIYSSVELMEHITKRGHVMLTVLQINRVYNFVRVLIINRALPARLIYRASQGFSLALLLPLSYNVICLACQSCSWFVLFSPRPGT